VQQRTLRSGKQTGYKLVLLCSSIMVLLALFLVAPHAHGLIPATTVRAFNPSIRCHCAERMQESGAKGQSINLHPIIGSSINLHLIIGSPTDFMPDRRLSFNHGAILTDRNAIKVMFDYNPRNKFATYTLLSHFDQQPHWAGGSVLPYGPDNLTPSPL